MRIWIAIWVGSAAISRTIAGWLLVAPVLRLLLVLLVAGFVKGLPWTTAIVVTLALVWLVLAVVLGLRAAPRPQASESAAPSEEPPATPPAADQEQPAGPAPLERAELVAALHATAAPHVHLAALAEHLNAPPERVREALREAGIPIAGGVRMKGRGVSTGVKAGDIPPLPADEGPAPGVDVVAGQPSNNNSNNASGFETVPDQANPHRTHVRWFQRRTDP